jgi:hypothetical protein
LPEPYTPLLSVLPFQNDINIYQQQKKSNLKCKFIIFRKVLIYNELRWIKERLSIKNDEESSMVKKKGLQLYSLAVIRFGVLNK